MALIVKEAEGHFSKTYKLFDLLPTIFAPQLPGNRRPQALM
jgi:hypothetical protein